MRPFSPTILENVQIYNPRDPVGFTIERKPNHSHIDAGVQAAHEKVRAVSGCEYRVAKFSRK